VSGRNRLFRIRETDFVSAAETVPDALLQNETEEPRARGGISGGRRIWRGRRVRLARRASRKGSRAEVVKSFSEGSRNPRTGVRERNWRNSGNVESR
jgi:hypothetical protein